VGNLLFQRKNGQIAFVANFRELALGRNYGS